MEKKELRNFIYFLTHNKNLTRQQKAKRDMLLSRDCFLKKPIRVAEDNNVDATSEDIVVNAKIPKTRLRHKDDKKNVINDEPKSGNEVVTTKQSDTLKYKVEIQEKDNVSFTKKDYLDPINLYTFLYEFNQDKVLRYTSHVLDDSDAIDEVKQLCKTKEYNFIKHGKLVKDCYNSLLKKLEKQKVFVDPKMATLISTYLTGYSLKNKKNETWSSQSVSTNWATLDLYKWARENQGVIPFPGPNIAEKQENEGYELEEAFVSHINGMPVRFMADLVLYFKSLFHIRRDNSLKRILSTLIQNERLDQKANISFSENSFRENIELFTDVDKLCQAFKKIIYLCCENQNKEKGEKPEIELSFIQEGKAVIFCIHHINTVYGKTAQDAKRPGDKLTSLLKNQINGLCDFFIEGDFGSNEYRRLNVWDGNESTDTPIDHLEGVKFTLKFKKL